MTVAQLIERLRQLPQGMPVTSGAGSEWGARVVTHADVTRYRKLTGNYFEYCDPDDSDDCDGPVVEVVTLL